MATRDPKAARNTDFIVRLDGINVPDDAAEKIAAGIRAVCMKELAGVDFHGDVSARIPFGPAWRGIWLREATQELNQKANLEVRQVER
ncbi:MAG TPA: hypothetical protein VGJ18_01390 [Gemmatimonadaceae bacterium]|jgi:predicted lipoprotein